ncbi:hypothetical protein [uncultured Aquimarina sp.]|uniref:hypothetical protein n=1 Tax=uncultured Aquimarina sp. TaxID=575652 RepID=UPI002617EFAC|nr:hypothetical protein [uncultured Aquimarina sp.]
MNSSILTYLFLISACFLTIGVHSQEKVTKEKNNFIDTQSLTNYNQMPVYTPESKSKMPVHNPNYELDKQINLALIEDAKKEEVLIAATLNTDPFSSLLINPEQQLSLGEIAKKLKGSN